MFNFITGRASLIPLLMVVSITAGCHGQYCCDQHINVFTNPVGNTINIPVIKDSNGNNVSSNAKEVKKNKNDKYFRLIKKISEREMRNNQINTSLNLKVQEEPQDTHQHQSSDQKPYDHIPHD